MVYFKIMNCKFILSLLFLSFISANIFATDLKVTNITKTDKNINIEFNNNLTLCNFISDNNSLISPYYENKGTKYYYFHFLNRNFKNDIIEQIKSDTVQFPKNDKNIEYKINKCNIVKNPKKVFAFMSIIFNNTVEVQCNIMKGDYGLWVAWPSVKEKDKWNKLFTIKDNELKKDIESALIKFYKQKRDKQNISQK